MKIDLDEVYTAINLIDGKECAEAFSELAKTLQHIDRTSLTREVEIEVNDDE